MLHVSCQMFTVQPKFPMLTINQILGPHSVQSETTLWWRTLCLISKKWGKKGKRELLLELLFYTYYYIYFFTSKPVTRTTKQVHPTSVALPCDRLFEEIWCSQQILAQARSSRAYNAVCTSNFPGNLSHIGPETESLYCFYRPTLNLERELPICVDRCHWGETVSRHVIEFDQREHSKI